jgi:hypothetical protein
VLNPAGIECFEGEIPEAAAETAAFAGSAEAGGNGGMGIQELKAVPGGLRAEIAKIIDKINQVSGKEMFDARKKDEIAEKVLSWCLVKGRSALVVGHSGGDYLPVLLAKLGLKVSVIDIDVSKAGEQENLHRQFGLDEEIESFTSYTALGDRRYDYIFVLAVINDAIDVLGRPDLQLFARISMNATAEMHAYIERTIKIALEPSVRDFIRPILAHLNPENGYIFVNAPGLLTLEAHREYPDLVNFVDKLLLSLDDLLPSLGDGLGIRFTRQLQMDVHDFGMHINPYWSNELRPGAVYRASKIEVANCGMAGTCPAPISGCRPAVSARALADIGLGQTRATPRLRLPPPPASLLGTFQPLSFLESLGNIAIPAINRAISKIQAVIFKTRGALKKNSDARVAARRIGTILFTKLFAISSLLASLKKLTFIILSLIHGQSFVKGILIPASADPADSAKAGGNGGMRHDAGKTEGDASIEVSPVVDLTPEKVNNGMSAAAARWQEMREASGTGNTYEISNIQCNFTQETHTIFFGNLANLLIEIYRTTGVRTLFTQGDSFVPFFDVDELIKAHLDGKKYSGLSAPQQNILSELSLEGEYNLLGLNRKKLLIGLYDYLKRQIRKFLGKGGGDYGLIAIGAYPEGILREVAEYTRDYIRDAATKTPET